MPSNVLVSVSDDLILWEKEWNGMVLKVKVGMGRAYNSVDDGRDARS